MNNEAYWRGFVKAASKSGLSTQQITHLIKRSFAPQPQVPSSQPPPLPQGAGMSAGPAPGGMAGMTGGQFGGLPQSPAGQGQQQPGQLALPWMLEQQKQQQLPQIPMPQAVTPTFNFGQR